MKNKIYIVSKDDREQLVRILATNGYTVRIGVDKASGKARSYIEYWRETDIE